MLNLDAGPKPEMIATDTAFYTDIVFGLFRLLGYRFSPRIADLSDQRFWRALLPGAPDSDYGPLNAVARHRVSLARIRAHWDDMTRVAGSLVTSQGRRRAARISASATFSARRCRWGLCRLDRHPRITH